MNYIVLILIVAWDILKLSLASTCCTVFIGVSPANKTALSAAFPVAKADAQHKKKGQVIRRRMGVVYL